MSTTSALKALASPSFSFCLRTGHGEVTQLPKLRRVVAVSAAHFKSYDDILRSIDDGRLDKIINEHKRYMKETGCEIWNL